MYLTDCHGGRRSPVIKRVHESSQGDVPSPLVIVGLLPKSKFLIDSLQIKNTIHHIMRGFIIETQKLGVEIKLNMISRTSSEL